MYAVLPIGQGPIGDKQLKMTPKTFSFEKWENVLKQFHFGWDEKTFETSL